MRHSFPNALTLIELLVVLALIVVIAAWVVPAASNFGRSTALTTTGNTLANLATLARQNSIAKNTLTAFVLLGEQGTADDFRAATLLEYDAAGAWMPLGNWSVFPAGIVVDKDDTTNCTFIANKEAELPFTSGDAENAPFHFQGKPVDRSAFAARIFLPNGSLQRAEKPAQIRVVEGFLNGGQVVRTRPGTNRPSANYYDVAIVGASGMVKASRP